ncbi:hypothetical protein O0L34_g17016 [Tuta absoluta]|nr:hypothetical protein O0L34_g17016 [Tuta absoluta]
MNDLENILELHRQGNWQEIAENYHDHPDRSKLLWVFPSVKNFRFLQQCMEELNCDSILSIGCGSGLLEWMITEATGIPVSGVEVDGAWWHCKYAPPKFIPILVTSPSIDEEIITSLKTASSTALMFCYFNNRPAFEEHVRLHTGKVLIIIGPDEKGVHTDPKPFNDLSNDWKLYKWQEVRDSRDFIAVYCKNIPLQIK